MCETCLLVTYFVCQRLDTLVSMIYSKFPQVSEHCYKDVYLSCVVKIPTECYSWESCVVKPVGESNTLAEFSWWTRCYMKYVLRVRHGQTLQPASLSSQLLLFCRTLFHLSCLSLTTDYVEVQSATCAFFPRSCCPSSFLHPPQSSLGGEGPVVPGDPVYILTFWKG